ncbi:MAG: hypothetical protein OEN55_03250, partial [Alphaproteobacteria bacterium]|nr:hypothetical protein [Alphaproteobacteria bacterium]
MTKGRNRSAEEGGPAGQEVTLAEKVAFLGRPDSYPGAAQRVEVVETHMSVVFLTELFAHKLKKPVHYEFLDFRTLEARRRSCREEIRLNRRLAPRVYIAAVPLVIDAAGHLHLDGTGEAVDWLVRMHRLPSERMLDRAILEGTVRAGELQAVARLLAGFYRQAVPVAIPASAFRRRLADAIARNRQDLDAEEFDLPPAPIAAVSEALGRTLQDDADLFDQRLRLGCVVEGHGDLRPEHVYLGPDPAVIDCLEFKRDFRFLDWADELAYLAMECERLGSADTGSEILETCCRELGDTPQPKLIDFYKAYRALLRARLAIVHLRDAHVDEPGKWQPRALEYLE